MVRIKCEMRTFAFHIFVENQCQSIRERAKLTSISNFFESRCNFKVSSSSSSGGWIAWPSAHGCSRSRRTATWRCRPLGPFGGLETCQQRCALPEACILIFDKLTQCIMHFLGNLKMQLLFIIAIWGSNGFLLFLVRHNYYLLKNIPPFSYSQRIYAFSAFALTKGSFDWSSSPPLSPWHPFPLSCSRLSSGWGLQGCCPRVALCRQDDKGCRCYWETTGIA